MSLKDTQELLDRLDPGLSDAALRMLANQYPCCLGTGKRPGGRGYCECLNGAIMRRREQAPDATEEQRVAIATTIILAMQAETLTFHERVTAEYMEMQRRPPAVSQQKDMP